MAFHNLCQKIDVDNIRAKLGSLPSISDIPHLKLPKSVTKLKNRKIFRNSREKVNANKSDSPKQISTNQNVQQLPPTHARFIDHTPQHISTISSLMHESGETYCRAQSIDDDYPIPRQFDRNAPLRPISPIRIIDIPKIPIPETHLNYDNNRTIVQRLQQGYKDITEFRFKHIFTKKTIVRKDSIRVEDYVNYFNEERVRATQLAEYHTQKERIEDYRFRFKETQQKSGHSYSISSNESVSSVSKPINESSTEKRKAGIAASRFARVRNPPRSMSLENDENAEKNLQQMPHKIYPNTSTLWSIKDYSDPQKPTEQLKKQQTKYEENASTEKTYLTHMQRLTRYVTTSSLDESGPDSEPETVIPKRKKTSKKNKAPITPQQSIESLETKKDEKRFDVIKNNFKRLHKSLKRSQASICDTEDEEVNTHKSKSPTRASKLSARLCKFKSDNEPADIEVHERNQSTIRKIINDKLQTFKKSFKKRSMEADNQTGDETTPEKHIKSGIFMKSLKQMRTRKNKTATAELNEIENNNEEVTKGEETKRGTYNFEQKFERARKSTFKKVNEKMQQIKFFQKSQEAEIPEGTVKKSNYYTDTDDEYQAPEEHNLYIDNNQLPEDYATRAIWSTKPINADMTDDTDSDPDYPRVLIHQDNTNVFESTLVIAVTRSPKPSVSPSASITEIEPPKTKQTDDVINQLSDISNESISKVCQSLSPSKIRRSSDGILNIVNINNTTTNQQQLRRSSISDYTTINCAEDEPWQITRTNASVDHFSKTKSIDIFEKNLQSGGVSRAFEDFDEALRDEPVHKIDLKARSFERESSEDTDAPDDDNSSRITKILAACGNKRSPSIEKQKHLYELDKSCESLILHVPPIIKRENLNIDDDDRPPSAPPSPPPSRSLPPPPLPVRRSSQIIHTKVQDQLSPVLKTQSPDIPKPQEVIPPKIPERTPSMSQISKPLVKTSSLRLAYSEQVNPNDVGKVNKLICRFEKPKIYTNRPRLIPRKAFNNYSDVYSEDSENSESDAEADLKMINTCNSININNKNRTIEPITRTTTTLPGKEEQLLSVAAQQLNTCVQSDRISISSSNLSHTGSEYGSPLEYASSLIGSSETTPVPERKKDSLHLRNRRSVVRDDELYHSFDSDEENSYYSISSSGSSRYIVDL